MVASSTLFAGTKNRVTPATATPTAKIQGTAVGRVTTTRESIRSKRRTSQMIIVRRGGQRSTSTPARGPTSTPDRSWAAATPATWVGEPVRRPTQTGSVTSVTASPS